VRRYWLRFDISAIYPAGWPPVVGVTGYSLDDCVEIVTRRYGRCGVARLTRVEPDPDLSTFERGSVPLGLPLGVPVWRGIWYPPENLAGPEPTRSKASSGRVNQSTVPHPLMPRVGCSSQGT
jgi:hypothetical protein